MLALCDVVNALALLVSGVFAGTHVSSYVVLYPSARALPTTKAQLDYFKVHARRRTACPHARGGGNL